MSLQHRPAIRSTRPYSSTLLPSRTLKVDEFAQPGTVANRIQELTESLNKIASRSPPAAPTFTGGGLPGLLGRLSELGKSKDDRSPAASGTRSASVAAFEPGVLTGYGKRQGGGWAPPAGRRISLRGSVVCPAGSSAEARVANSARNSLADTLRPTSHAGGQSAAPLDRIVPQIGCRVPSNDPVDRLLASDDAHVEPKIALSPRHVTMVDIFQSQSRQRQLGSLTVDPAATYSITNPLHNSTAIITYAEEGLEDVSQTATEALQRGSQLLPEPRMLAYPASKTSRDSLVSSFSPGTGRSQGSETVLQAELTPSYLRTRRSPKPASWEGDVTSTAALQSSRASLAHNSHSDGQRLSFCDSCEDCLAELSRYPLTASPDTYQGTYPAVMEEKAALSVHSGQEEQNRTSPSQDQVFPRVPKDGQRDVCTQRDGQHVRPKLSKAPKHSVSVASLQAVLRRNESQDRHKASTWPLPTPTKASSKAFGLFDLLPSLFTWKERQGSHDAQDGRPTAHSQDEPHPEERGSEDSKSMSVSVAQTLKGTPMSVERSVQPRRSPRIPHWINDDGGFEHSPTDCSGVRDDQVARLEESPLIADKPGHHMRSSEAASHVAALDVARGDGMERFFEAPEIDDASSRRSKPSDHSYAPSHQRNLGDPPHQEPGQRHRSTATHPDASSEPAEHAARVGRVSVMIKSRETMQIVVSLQIQPGMAPRRVSVMVQRNQSTA